MTPTRRHFAALALGAPLAIGLVPSPARAVVRQPLVIATGGPSGDAPAGTIGAYEQAIRDGADIIAAVFAPSKDGILVARPDDHELSAGTDVASRPEFAARRRSRTIQGRELNGWFVEDFTLAELKTLVCQPAGGRRRNGASGEAGHAILTFEEIVSIARAGSVRTARVIGVWAGLTDAAYFSGLDLAVEPILAGAIRLAGYNFPAAAMFVGSSEPASLKAIGELTRARRVLRLVSETPGELEDMTAIRAYAQGVAAPVGRLIDLSTPKTLPPTALIPAAHAAGLTVQAWTAGDAFPPPPFRSGDARRLTAALYAADCDAVAGDLAGLISRVRDEAVPRDR